MIENEEALRAIRIATDELQAANRRWLIANVANNPRLRAEAVLVINAAVSRIVAIAGECDPARNPNAEKEN